MKKMYQLIMNLYENLVKGEVNMLTRDYLFNVDEGISVDDLINNKGFKNELKKYDLFEVASSSSNDAYIEIDLLPYRQEEVKEFIKMCTLSQEQLKKKMSNLIKRTYEDVRETTDYIIAKGDIPITLVAHLDTVFSDGKNESDIKISNNIITSNLGLGGDDRCGVFIISNIIKKCLRPNIILTTNEEQGCLGAKTLADSKDLLLCSNSKYLLELDRKGNNDAVFYDSENTKFIKYFLETFKFNFEIGTSSDIKYLSPKLNIASVNISCGYYNPHRCTEYVNLKDMKLTEFKVIYMLCNVPDVKFEFKYVI